MKTQLVVLCLLSCGIIASQGLKCYTCVYTNDEEFQEIIGSDDRCLLNGDAPDVPELIVECPAPAEDQVCVTAYMVKNGTILLDRFCTDRSPELEMGCTFNVELETTFCYCDGSDACNSGNGTVF